MNKLKILSIDPSGTGTTGFYFSDFNNEFFKEYKDKNWKNHYNFIISMLKEYKIDVLIYENTNFINKRTADSLNLIRLLGAIEFIKVNSIVSINVLKVKKISKDLFKRNIKIKNLEYLPGRSKGWMYKNNRISIHQLEAFILNYLFINNS